MPSGEYYMETLFTNKHFIRVSTIFIVILCVLALANLFNGQKDINQNMISLSGHGEITAVPDIATITFNIHKEAKTVKDAQAAVAVVEKSTLAFLKTNNVDSKDIKTTGAPFNPIYQYKTDAQVMPCNQYGCPPVNGKNVITGYESNESFTVKIRNADDAGKITQGLGTIGVSDLYGPTFSIDNEDTLKADARAKAIADAQEKAERLAHDLGVHLGKITSFSENGNYPMPMYAKADMAVMNSAGAPTLELSKGENVVSSDVTITYEIR